MKIMNVVILLVGLFASAPAAFGAVDRDVRTSENRRLSSFVGGKQDCEVMKKNINSNEEASSGKAKFEKLVD